MNLREGFFVVVFALVQFSCKAQSAQKFHPIHKTQSTDSLKKLDIYILMGQSNMSGRGHLTDEHKERANPNVFVFNKELSWTIAHHPLHFDKPEMVGVGPGLSFGISMLKNHHQIGLVPTAVGGTAINLWKAGAYDKKTNTCPYDDAVKRIKEAMKYGTIKGVIWHHGESDSNPDSAQVYLPKLIKLIQNVREIVENPELPFVVGKLGTYNLKYQSINNQLPLLAQKINFTALVSSQGLKDGGDGIHFDAESAEILGKRYAKKMSQLQNLINKQ